VRPPALAPLADGSSLSSSQQRTLLCPGDKTRARRLGEKWMDRLVAPLVE
jgi:hypothetical protein